MIIVLVFTLAAFAMFLALLTFLLVLFLRGDVTAMKAGADAVYKCLLALRGIFRVHGRRR